MQFSRYSLRHMTFVGFELPNDRPECSSFIIKMKLSLFKQLIDFCRRPLTRSRTIPKRRHLVCTTTAFERTSDRSTSRHSLTATAHACAKTEGRHMRNRNTHAVRKKTGMPNASYYMSMYVHRSTTGLGRGPRRRMCVKDERNFRFIDSAVNQFCRENAIIKLMPSFSVYTKITLVERIVRLNKCL